jgi:RimJ/RimL family protein N-acetyltransferase
MTDIPRITTPRLLLREFQARDVDAYAAMMADPAVTRHLGDGRPLSRVDAWRQLAMFAGHWTLRGFGVWAVEERATGAFAGRIGCFEPEGWPALEIAYTLARPFWGRGYASEGAAAALRYARTHLVGTGDGRRRRLVSVIRPGNAGSIRVAERLGAVAEADEIEFFGAPARLYVYPDEPAA